MKFKVIFIDIDNTIFDFDAYTIESLKSGFKKFNLGEYDDNVLATFHRENDILWHKIETKELTFEELMKIRFNIIFNALNIKFDGVVFENYFRTSIYDSAIFEKNVLEVLNYLKDKEYTLAVASNGPYDQQIHRLKIGNIYDLFSYYFVSENIGYSKPSKDFFDEAFKRIDDSTLKRSECLIIGDSLTSDIKGGINSNIKTCFYNKKKLKDFDKSNIDYIVNDLIELKDIL